MVLLQSQTRSHEGSAPARLSQNLFRYSTEKRRLLVPTWDSLNLQLRWKLAEYDKSLNRYMIHFENVNTHMLQKR